MNIELDLTQRETWLAKRRDGIGGSDVGAICGLNRYKTPLDVYNEKISDVRQEENEAMLWGNILEDPIADHWSKVTGRKTEHRLESFTHKSIPYLFASPDRIILEDENDEELPKTRGILEVKTAGIFSYRNWESEPPLSYMMQLQHYLDVMDLSWGEFAVLIGGQEFRRYFVGRDDELIKMKNERLQEFWECYVLKRIPPPPINTEEILGLYPKYVEGKTIQADGAIQNAITALEKISSDMKELKEKETEIKDFIRSRIGDAEAIYDGGKKLFTWKNTTEFDESKLQAENPELYTKYIKTVFDYTSFAAENKKLAENRNFRKLSNSKTLRKY